MRKRAVEHAERTNGSVLQAGSISPALAPRAPVWSVSSLDLDQKYTQTEQRVLCPQAVTFYTFIYFFNNCNGPTPHNTRPYKRDVKINKSTSHNQELAQPIFNYVLLISYTKIKHIL